MTHGVQPATATRAATALFLVALALLSAPAKAQPRPVHLRVETCDAEFERDLRRLLAIEIQSRGLRLVDGPAAVTVEIVSDCDSDVQRHALTVHGSAHTSRAVLEVDRPRTLALLAAELLSDVAGARAPAATPRPAPLARLGRHLDGPEGALAPRSPVVWSVGLGAIGAAAVERDAYGGGPRISGSIGWAEWPYVRLRVDAAYLAVAYGDGEMFHVLRAAAGVPASFPIGEHRLWLGPRVGWSFAWRPDLPRGERFDGAHRVVLGGALGLEIALGRFVAFTIDTEAGLAVQDVPTTDPGWFGPVIAASVGVALRDH